MTQFDHGSTLCSAVPIQFSGIQHSAFCLEYSMRSVEHAILEFTCTHMHGTCL